MDCFVASLPCANASRLSQAMTKEAILAMSAAKKTWMAGTSPAMTVDRNASLAPEPLAKHLFQNLPLDVLVGHRGIVPPPAVALHLFGRRDKTVDHFAEIRVGVVQAEDQPSRSDPAQRQPLGAQIILQHPVVAGRLGILHHPDRGEVADADGQIACRQ